MSRLPRLSSWWRAAFRRPGLNREIDEELAFHVDRYAEDLERQGVPPDEANRRARAEMGSVDGRREVMREALGLRLLDELCGDVIYTLRILGRAPTFTIVAVLTIALGVGANAAVFSLMESALWKPLPVRAPERLRLLSWVSGPNDVMTYTSGPSITSPAGERTETPFSYAVFAHLRRSESVLEDLCAFRTYGRLTAVIDGQAELIGATLVSGNYYQTLGVTPAVGRPILASDDTSGAGVVGVISDGFWSRRFGRGLGVIGKRIEINRVPLLIVGVNPRGFTGADLGSEPEIFLPLSAQPGMVPSRYSRTTSLLDDPNAWWLSLIGHLEPSVSDARALSALEWAFQQAVQTTLPDKAHLDRPHLRLLNGSRGVDELRQAFGKPLFVLVGLAGFVLLLACANLANLLLARSGSRGREIGLRLALGAGRARVARQMLTEGLVLALFGGGAGLVAGYWVRNAIPSLLGGSWERVPFQAAFDGRVLAVSIGLTLITGILFSLAPAWQATRTPINTWLKDAGRATRRPSRIIGARPLIVLQVALSGVLLAGAGLFVRTLTNLNRADLGFRPDRLVLFAVDPPRAKDDGKRRAELFGRLEEAIRGIPGVQAVGLSTSPLVGHDTSTTSVGPDGRAPRRGDPDRAWLNDVGREFFQTLGIPILQGRAFDEHDGPTSPPVVVVNRQFVRKFFPSGDALNHTVLNDGVLFRIVGVAGDTRFRDVRAPAPPTLFRPYFQLSDVGAMTFEIKTELGDAALVQAIRESMRTIDPDLPLGDVRSQRAQIDATLSQERMLATLTSTFGLLAIVLTCIGIYGVVANAVARRTAEIGIRMALGAQRHEVMRMILGEIAGSVGLGLAAGSVAILGVGRFLESLLYGVRPLDPPTITSAILLVLLTALAASSIPARRASRLSPTIALRHE